MTKMTAWKQVSREVFAQGMLALASNCGRTIEDFDMENYYATFGPETTDAEWPEIVALVKRNLRTWPTERDLRDAMAELREGDYETREREDAEDLAEMERQADRERGRR